MVAITDAAACGGDELLRQVIMRLPGVLDGTPNYHRKNAGFPSR